MKLKDLRVFYGLTKGGRIEGGVIWVCLEGRERGVLAVGVKGCDDGGGLGEEDHGDECGKCYETISLVLRRIAFIDEAA